MPGKLVVLARSEPRAGWIVLGAGLSVAEAQGIVDRASALNANARLVVAQAIRSFTITAAPTEDADATIDP